MPPKKLKARGKAAAPPEPNIATKPSARKKSAPEQHTEHPAPEETSRYIRNLRGINARVSLISGRRIEFEPRGQRGDLAAVTKEERQDPLYLQNRGVIFEEIDQPTAMEIISKQQINASAPHPTLMDHLRNEQGEAYEQRDVHVEIAKERQGFTVAEIAADTGDRHVSANPEGEVVRHAAGPEQVQVPGSVGHPATNEMASLPDDISAEEVREFLEWKRAQKLRESLSVGMEPVERVEDDENE